jgi:hypothetical protein
MRSVESFFHYNFKSNSSITVPNCVRRQFKVSSDFHFLKKTPNNQRKLIKKIFRCTTYILVTDLITAVAIDIGRGRRTAILL